MSWPYWGALSGVLALGAVAAPLPGQLPPIPEMPDTFRQEAGKWVGNQPYNELTVQLQWQPGDGKRPHPGQQMGGALQQNVAENDKLPCAGLALIPKMYLSFACVS